uniref:Protein m139 n=1 Tax=Mastomys natalensis cytomegalovirus 1 TaxID=2973541 RepID=A0A9Y1IKY6_9BETA|nr:protein m139 [Mastomys natalensis cytomegalovirus 1]
MWSLRGAQRRDMRYDGREYDDGTPGEFPRDRSVYTTNYCDLECVGELLERNLSPVYPPETIVNSMSTASLSGESEQENEELDEDVAECEENHQDNHEVDVAYDHELVESESDDEIERDSDQSDSDEELIHVGAGRAAAVVSKKMIEDYERQRLSSKLFCTVLRDFKPFHSALRNPGRIHYTVKLLLGKPLSLRFPEHWYLLPQRASKIRVLQGVNLNDYVCCDRELIPLGACAARSPDLHYRETPCALAMDLDGRFFVFDAETDGLFLAASGIVELATKGLSQCEPAYKDGGAVIPTPNPKSIARCLITVSVFGPDHVRSLTKDLSGTAISIGGPWSGRQTVFQIFGEEETKNKMPFSLLDADSFEYMLEYITFRVTERYAIAGGIGKFSNDGMIFHVHNLILVGDSRCVYGFNVSENDVYRLSDDMATFVKTGYFRRANRFDKGARGILRLERKPMCPHSDKLSHVPESLRPKPTRKHIDGWFKWIMYNKPDRVNDTAFANIDEAKRQCRYPAKGIPAVVMDSESYQPRPPPQSYDMLSEGVSNFVDPVTSNEHDDEPYYRRWMCMQNSFPLSGERTLEEVLNIRGQKLAAMKKASITIPLPNVSHSVCRELPRGTSVTNRR